MQLTQQARTIGAIGITLAVFAVVVNAAVLVVGASLVFGWLLAVQITAVRQFQTTTETTTVSISPETITTHTDSEIPVTLTVERPPHADSATISISMSLPPAASSVPKSNRSLTLSAGETYATTTVMLSVPVAGRMQFPQPTWTVTEPHGLFAETVERGPTPTVTIEAPTIQDLHVGRGGTQVTAFGEHPTDKTGDGITPASLRQYLDGDPADRIDWKATARLNEAHVREYEAESDLEISLIVDHRGQMGYGTDTKTMLSYAREAALGIVSNADAVGDPIGLLTVGDGGLTTTEPATTQPTGYARIKEHILALEPTPRGPPPSAVQLQHPESTRQLTRRLAGSDTAFAETLRIFTADATSYIRQVESDPLYEAVQYVDATTTTTQLTVIVTSDYNRSQLRETVRTAVRGNNAVLVFLTPEVLFEPSGLSDIDQLYDRYEKFEEFRTQLERLGPVVAYEIAPGDRLAAVLSARSQTANNNTRNSLRGLQ